MKFIKRNQQQTRAHNRQLVIQTIYDQCETSRMNVARQTGLTRTTVSDLVSELMAEGLVEETGQGQSNGGKRPTLLKFIDDRRCLISVDLASHEFQGAVVNLRGQIINKVSLHVGESKGEDALKLVFELIDKLIDLAVMPIIGIGIGSPGLVDPISGTIEYAVNLDWRDLPLAELIRERYELARACCQQQPGSRLCGNHLWRPPRPSEYDRDKDWAGHRRTNRHQWGTILWRRPLRW